MRISYRTHPVLSRIHDGELSRMAVPSVDNHRYKEQMVMFDKFWELHSQSFSKNIQVITKPFLDAMTLAFPKMSDPTLCQALFDRELCGTIIKGDFSYCYHIVPSSAGGFIQTVFQFSCERGKDPMMEAFIHLNLDENMKGSARVYFANIGEVIQPSAQMKRCNTILYTMLNFIKYAEIELKELQPNSVKKGIDLSYVNDTSLKVNLLDSKWFTTLVKSDAFKVRGHFRLQPKKKDGEWTKELIWINDFQKDGYTAPARKLNYLES
jgi:hypothetical protein